VRRRSARVRVRSHFPGQTLEWKIRALQIDNLAFRGRWPRSPVGNRQQAGTLRKTNSRSR